MRKRETVCTFETLRALFAVLVGERTDIAFRGIHVQLLTGCFYEQLPGRYRRAVRRDELEYGALFHDIGKLRIPEDILNKAGKLAPGEMEQMKAHAGLGADMLARIPGLEPLGKWVGYHHERIDGKGYFGLKGEEIPIEARILAITDTYSSITEASAFKPSRTHEDAVSVIRMGAGTQFDRELAEIFCQIPGVVLARAGKEAEEIMKMEG